jgi:hypothetical protein
MTAASHILPGLSLTLALTLGGGSAWAQASSSTQVTGSVVIVDPPQFSKGAELTVAPVQRPAAQGSVSAQAVGGRYEVSGVAGDTFNIAMPSSLKLVRAGGTEEVVLSLSPGAAATTLSGAAGARSRASVAVQGVVGVTGAATPGLYEGSFPVILSLQ